MCMIVFRLFISYRYDLTGYLSKHPPGGQMILNFALKGQDAKRMYSIHSARAKALWESYLIGTIVD